MSTISALPVSFGSIYKYTKKDSAIYGEAETGAKAFDFYGKVDGNKLEVTFEPPYDIPGSELYKAEAQINTDGAIDINTFAVFGKQQMASTMFVKDVLDLAKRAFGIEGDYKASAKSLEEDSAHPKAHTQFTIDA